MVSFKLCDRDMDCDACPFDRALRAKKTEGHPESSAGTHRINTPGGLPEMELADHCFYDSNHIWARVEGQGRLRFGIDDLGQRILGPVYAIDLPSVGSRVAGGNSVMLINQLGSVSLELPAKGQVTWVNSELHQRPGLVNRSPYGTGSLLVVEPENLTESLQTLRFGQEADTWFRYEAERLAVDVAQVAFSLRSDLGPTATDGGQPFGDWLESVRKEEAFFPVLLRYFSRTPGLTDRRR